ncbi:MAG: carboxypeptidase-like regulatory domain-containing protein [Gemmatimonadota bacterium]|nr:carboxypeptidase-like regulatory domain-containing protein [Gemmatimonadota bacterium]
MGLADHDSGGGGPCVSRKVARWTSECIVQASQYRAIELSSVGSACQLLVLVVLLSGHCVIAAAQAPTTTVSGSVRDTSGVPITGAEVLIGRRSGRTTASGAFLVDSVTPGRNTLTVRGIGLVPVRSVIDVPVAGLTDLTFHLSAAVTILPTISVSGQRQGIYGTVALVGERAAVGAWIQVLGPGGGEIQADSGGRFAFPNLRQGSYLVRITLPQFSERRIAVLLGRNEGKELAINLLPSSVVSSRADGRALEDLGKRLSFGLRMDRVMRDDLSKRGSIDVCDLPQLRSTIGGPNGTITLIVNGTTVYRNMPVHSLCSWRADEIELVEFGSNICTDVTGTVATLVGAFCSGFGRRIAPPRNLPGQSGRMGGVEGPFVLVWEKR